ncbi:2OG-Fe(II) oxygenase [Aeromicrobium sp. Root495]|uniref:2OG-Fe(II) oxygenase n=1 Tax=Aeromicrobium sp. Root495 TaxID=1736550 RepID=UPI0012E7BE69|nr:2OG-Fe(II) oxygenase [Aeromicrobium sp. Root495]
MRVVPADYEPASQRCTAQEGWDRANTAEDGLRSVVESGFETPIALAAPERGSLVSIGAGGVIENAFAWIENPERSDHNRQLIQQHTGLAALRLVIKGERWQTDPHSDEFAALGSCLIHRGRVVKVSAAHWLVPVADQVADLCGVPVDDLEFFGSGGQRPVIESAEPAMISDALPPEICDELIELHRRSTPTQEGPGAPELVEVPATEPWISRVPSWSYAQALGEHYGLPVAYLNVFVLRYFPGAAQDWHIDNSPKQSQSLNRTVSFSVHLSQQGVDYEGADLETEHGTFADAGRGDLVGFTAKTLHRVTALKSGERYALICFGSHD